MPCWKSVLQRQFLQGLNALYWNRAGSAPPQHPPGPPASSLELQRTLAFGSSTWVKKTEDLGCETPGGAAEQAGLIAAGLRMLSSPLPPSHRPSSVRVKRGHSGLTPPGEGRATRGEGRGRKKRWRKKSRISDPGASTRGLPCADHHLGLRRETEAREEQGSRGHAGRRRGRSPAASGARRGTGGFLPHGAGGQVRRENSNHS